MYSGKYNICVVCVIELHAIAFTQTMPVRFSQWQYLYYTVENVSTDITKSFQDCTN